MTVIFCHFIGDPLYVTGGQPHCFDPESVEESFAQDGYRLRLLYCISFYWEKSILIFNSSIIPFFITDTTYSYIKFRGYQRPLNPVPGDCGYHLHAHRLIFCHPLTNKVSTRTSGAGHIELTPPVSRLMFLV